MPALLALCLTLAHAIEPAPPRPAATTDHRSAALISPLGVGSAIVGNALGTPTFDATLRFHHMPTDPIGLSLQTDLTWSIPFDFTVSYAGLRGGPRIALRRRGLEDWTVTPLVLFGVTTLSAAGERLARYGTLGVGVEADRTWVWNRFTMELGLAAYTAAPVAYTARAEVFEGQRVPSVFPVKPSLTWSLGYAF